MAVAEIRSRQKRRLDEPSSQATARRPLRAHPASPDTEGGGRPARPRGPLPCRDSRLGLRADIARARRAARDRAPAWRGGRARGRDRARGDRGAARHGRPERGHAPPKVRRARGDPRNFARGRPDPLPRPSSARPAPGRGSHAATLSRLEQRGAPSLSERGRRQRAGELARLRRALAQGSQPVADADRPARSCRRSATRCGHCAGLYLGEIAEADPAPSLGAEIDGS